MGSLFCYLDIDECKEKVCDHLCFNRPGSYKCGCYRGYLLVHHRYCKSDGMFLKFLFLFTSALVKGFEILSEKKGKIFFVRAKAKLCPSFSHLDLKHHWKLARRVGQILT